MFYFVAGVIPFFPLFLLGVIQFRAFVEDIRSLSSVVQALRKPKPL